MEGPTDELIAEAASQPIDQTLELIHEGLRNDINATPGSPDDDLSHVFAWVAVTSAACTGDASFDPAPLPAGAFGIMGIRFPIGRPPSLEQLGRDAVEKLGKIAVDIGRALAAIAKKLGNVATYSVTVGFPSGISVSLTWNA